MPRSSLKPTNGTPFARVLTAHMWSKTPPWSGGKLAAVLGLHRARVARWITSDAIPELDTMLAVMAHLGIPLRALLDCYAESGTPIPAIERDEAQQQAIEADRIQAVGHAAAQYYPVIPPARQGRGGGIGGTTGSHQPPQLSDEERERLEREQADREWQTALAHTRMTLRMTGMSEAAIDAMLVTVDTDRAH